MWLNKAIEEISKTDTEVLCLFIDLVPVNLVKDFSKRIRDIFAEIIKIVDCGFELGISFL
jgi:hypothetical protein